MSTILFRSYCFNLNSWHLGMWWQSGNIFRQLWKLIINMSLLCTRFSCFIICVWLSDFHWIVNLLNIFKPSYHVTGWCIFIVMPLTYLVLFVSLMVPVIPRRIDRSQLDPHRCTVSRTRYILYSMTIWHGNVFRITGPLCKESIGHWFFGLVCTICQTSNRTTEDLRHL